MTQLPLLPLPLLPLPSLPAVNLPPARSAWFPIEQEPWEPGTYEVANGDPDCVPVMCRFSREAGYAVWWSLPDGAIEWRGLAAPVNSAG